VSKPRSRWDYGLQSVNLTAAPDLSLRSIKGNSTLGRVEWVRPMPKPCLSCPGGARRRDHYIGTRLGQVQAPAGTSLTYTEVYAPLGNGHSSHIVHRVRDYSDEGR
jgi:hypothetical protein